MELFGLLFAFPVTLVASVVFCTLASMVFKQWPQLIFPTGAVSALIVLSFILEITAMVYLGASYLHNHFLHIYGIIHGINFVFGPPALACLFLIQAPPTGQIRFAHKVFTIVVCWIACMVALFANISSDEAINGIDGVPTTEMK